MPNKPIVPYRDPTVWILVERVIDGVRTLVWVRRFPGNAAY